MRISLPGKLFAYSLQLLLAFSLLAPGVSAQDNSQGRYRPEGRQVGVAVGREFGERIYEVRTYSPEVASDAFAGAMVFYPLTLSFDPPNGAVAFVPGFRASSSNYEWWGPTLASLGYTVFILDTNSPTDGLAARAEALKAAVELIASENSNAASPINNKIDTSKIAIMGHSMGGGASLAAAADMGDAVKAVIPLQLYCCEPGGSFDGDYSGLNTPALLIATATDDVAPPAQHARLLYDSIGGPKVYMEFAEGDHMVVTNAGNEKQAIGRSTLAFLKVVLDGKTNLQQHVDNPGDAYADRLSTYEANL